VVHGGINRSFNVSLRTREDLRPSPLIDPLPSYRRLFWKSRHHLWLGLLTVGLGFASGQPLALIAGVTMYALGLVFLPDSGFFRRSVDARREAELARESAAELAAFQKEFDRLSSGLSSGRQAKYAQLRRVCEEIERASAETQKDTGLDLPTQHRKLDELLWTYLRMLAVEQSLDVYLETERKEQLPALLQAAERETEALAQEVTQLKSVQPAPPILETKERLLTSRLERSATLKQRLTRLEQAQANIDLIRSEQERLVEQVKLIRADAIASRNAEGLSARLDSSIEHLTATNRWLTEIDQYQTLTQGLPDLPTRLTSLPPVVPSSSAHSGQRTPHSSQQ